MKKSLAICSFVLVVTGCATTGGKNLDVSKISKGTTTKAEVIEILGSPDQEITSGDGRTICTWVSVRQHENFLLGALIDQGVDNTAQKEANRVTGREVSTVQIVFSAAGIVGDITTSKSGHL